MYHDPGQKRGLPPDDPNSTPQQFQPKLRPNWDSSLPPPGLPPFPTAQIQPLLGQSQALAQHQPPSQSHQPPPPPQSLNNPNTPGSQPAAFRTPGAPSQSHNIPTAQQLLTQTPQSLAQQQPAFSTLRGTNLSLPGTQPTTSLYPYNNSSGLFSNPNPSAPQNPHHTITSLTSLSQPFQTNIQPTTGLHTVDPFQSLQNHNVGANGTSSSSAATSTTTFSPHANYPATSIIPHNTTTTTSIATFFPTLSPQVIAAFDFIQARDRARIDEQEQRILQLSQDLADLQRHVAQLTKTPKPTKIKKDPAIFTPAAPVTSKRTRKAYAEEDYVPSPHQETTIKTSSRRSQSHLYDYDVPSATTATSGDTHWVDDNNYISLSPNQEKLTVNGADFTVRSARCDCCLKPPRTSPLTSHLISHHSYILYRMYPDQYPQKKACDACMLTFSTPANHKRHVESNANHGTSQEFSIVVNAFLSAYELAKAAVEAAESDANTDVGH